MSPTVFIIGSYRFFFNSREETRRHVHTGVWQDNRNQVFWLHMPPTYATATLR